MFTETAFYWPKKLSEYLLFPVVDLWIYILKTTALALIPSAMMYGLALTATRYAGFRSKHIEAPVRSATGQEFFASVVFAPIVESLLLMLLLFLLLKVTKNQLHAAIVSALLWGAFHAWAAPLWFFGVVWSFFVYSCAYLGWRKRSMAWGFVAAAVPHALINLLAISLSSFI